MKERSIFWEHRELQFHPQQRYLIEPPLVAKKTEASAVQVQIFFPSLPLPVNDSAAK